MSEKLIRDGVPAKMKAQGLRPNLRSLEDGEINVLLRKKLVEEAHEAALAEERSLGEELADVLEVVLCLAEYHGISPADLEAIRRSKLTRVGGFEAGVVLIETEKTTT